MVGHADIASTRKQDPGILFPWGKLYSQYQVGVWLEGVERSKEGIQDKFTPKEKLPQDVNDSFFFTHLEKYGYDVDVAADMRLTKNRSAATAFQAHFSQNQYPTQYDNGEISRMDMLWIWGLDSKYKSGE